MDEQYSEKENNYRQLSLPKIKSNLENQNPDRNIPSLVSQLTNNN